jgi:hypothetical protein
MCNKDLPADLLEIHLGNTTTSTSSPRCSPVGVISSACAHAATVEVHAQKKMSQDLRYMSSRSVGLGNTERRTREIRPNRRDQRMGW